MNKTRWQQSLDFLWQETPVRFTRQISCEKKAKKTITFHLLYAPKSTNGLVEVHKGL